MKKLVSLLLFFASLTNTAEAQKVKEKDVPSSVRNALYKEYPAIKKCYWGKDSANYQASFFTGKAPIAVTYDGNGKRIITEMQMPVEDLPRNITDYVQKNFPGKIYKNIVQVTDASGAVSYEVQIGDLALEFDNNGDFIQSLKCDE